MTLIVGVVMAAAAAACSSSSTTGAGSPGANEVWMQGSVFVPATRTVTTGTSVTWTNKDNITHNITSSSVPVGASAFASGSVNLNGGFSTQLTVAGTYQYFCTIHGTATTGMHGTIVVN
jgi:plastocyanin